MTDVSNWRETIHYMQIFYHCSNNGDGSVSVHFHQTQKQADKAEEKEIMEEGGWAESSASSIDLKVEGDKIYFASEKWVKDRWINQWKEIKE